MDKRTLCLIAALMLALAGGPIACSDSRPSCLKAGTCECRSQADCPEGEHCVDGFCRRVVGPELPTKGFGEPCLQDSDCVSGLCLPAGPGNGQACTLSCAEEPCPDGWECKPDLAAGPDDPQALCVQRITSRLCQACSVGSQCNAIGDACVQLADEFVCAADCSLQACSAGYDCTDVTVDGHPARQCLPTGGACTCGLSTIGLTRPCATSNGHGVCRGQQTCEDSEPQPDWSACDAPAPAAEVCNGIDDDCDGLVDAGDPGVDSSGLPDDPPYPSCRKGPEESQCIGQWHCQPDAGGAYAWVCGATDPTNEVCNGLDDNCDGVPDDPFIDAQGRYVRSDNCGDCGIDCSRILPNLRTGPDGQVLPGAATCSLRAGRPTCVPLMCEPGTYPFPEAEPTTCAALVSPACQPCSTDADCRISSDRCIAVGTDPGGHCAQSCEPASAYAGCSGQTGVQSCCPDDYLCELFQGQRLCLPAAGTCTCNAQRVGQTRTCLITGAAGELCQGVQTCLPAGADYSWGDCQQSDVVVEVCDYLDNNCDGQVDEGFRDEDGRYTTDEHCGACNVNCPARWDPEFQHAIGGCVEEGGGFACHIVACTTETEPAHRPCRHDEECQPGGTCDPRLAICQPDAPGGCPAGDCGTPCADDGICVTTYGPGFFCDPASAACAVQFQNHNPNQTEADGCECAQLLGAGPDEPDASDVAPEPGWVYVDADCDGIDGEAATSLFVWAGTPRSRGTREEPYATITEAIAAFDPSRHSAVLVAAGTYRENLVLTSGLRLYGGYNPTFADRDVVLFPSLIVGNEPDHADPNQHPGTIYAAGLSGRTVLNGFIVQGYDVNYDPPADQPAPSSYTIYVRNCGSGLELTNNWILGGRGGDGADGATGSSGAIGADGQAGHDSAECPNSPDCAGMTSPGGSGGANQACASANGRPGATARGSGTDPQDYQGGGLDGRGGWDSTYINDMIDESLCKYDCQVGVDTSNNADDARAGPDGQPGGGGSGCGQSSGQVVGGLFQASAGGGGAAGAAGGGGGGGGAGGAVYNDNFYQNPPCTVGQPFGDRGGSGGGGGAGGCGGTGGRPGGGGGGSFGVFVTFSSAPASLPIIRGNRIRRGFGGFGGAAGGGGQGGLGGQGGDGGRIAWPAWCAGAGGRGGRGGAGGAGGGGGGGCGGVSYGIAGEHLASAGYAATNTFSTPGTPDTGGAGGPGGGSPAGQGSAGQAGSDGATADVEVFQ